MTTEIARLTRFAAAMENAPFGTKSRGVIIACVRGFARAARCYDDAGAYAWQGLALNVLATRRGDAWSGDAWAEWRHHLARHGVI
jgi:apolipoprotein N-acyltransferase